MCRRINRSDVVIGWLIRGIDNLYWAFRDDDPFSMHRVFHLAMGFELTCKAYLLGHDYRKYDGLFMDEGKMAVDELAREIGHKFHSMIGRIEKAIGKREIQKIIGGEHIGFDAKDLPDVLQAAYLESRYPALIPIHEKLARQKDQPHHVMPLYSSGLPDVCYSFCRFIIKRIKKDFDISIPSSLFDSIVYGSARDRFVKAFMGDKIHDYID